MNDVFGIQFIQVALQAAAVVARGMGKPCVCGAEALKIDATQKVVKISGTATRNGQPVPSLRITEGTLAVIEKAFRESGLEAVSTSDLGPGENASDALWEALTESRAFVIVLSSNETTPNMMFEFGAAKAWK